MSGGEGVPSKRERELCGLVEEALEAVGAQGRISQELHRVVLSRRETHVRIDLTLTLHKDSPVCCPEPSCYVQYLGYSRYDVPAAIADRLRLSHEPRVQIVVQVVHESGYRYSAVPCSGTDCVVKFDPDWFIEHVD